MLLINCESWNCKAFGTKHKYFLCCKILKLWNFEYFCRHNFYKKCVNFMDFHNFCIFREFPAMITKDDLWLGKLPFFTSFFIGDNSSAFLPFTSGLDKFEGMAVEFLIWGALSVKQLEGSIEFWWFMCGSISKVNIWISTFLLFAF